MVIRINRKGLKSVLLNILIFVFLFTKVQRGFVESSEVGGIWNYIQILFLMLGFATFLVHNNRLIKVSICQIWMFYCILIIPSILISFTFNIGYFFKMIMAFYPAAILFLFYNFYLNEIDSESIILKSIFYIICFEFMLFMIDYYIGAGIKTSISNAYYPLCLLPIIVAKTRKSFKWFPMLIVTMTVLLSSKRAGLIAIILGILLYYFIQSISSSRLIKFLKSVLMVIVVSIVMYYLVVYLDNKFSIGVIERMGRLVEDGGSGRVERWGNIFVALHNSNFINIIFGHGYNKLLNSIGEAHNDFLQILYESGMFAMGAYVLYFICIVRELGRMYRYHFKYTAEFAMSIVFTVTLALFSFYIIEPTFITCGMISQGYLLAEWNKEKKGRSFNVKRL